MVSGGREEAYHDGYDEGVADVALAWHVCELFVTLGIYLDSYRKQQHWKANYGPDALGAYQRRWTEAEVNCNWILENE